MPIRLAIVGLGKIARDEHLPAIAANSDFELVAVAGPIALLGALPAFQNHSEMLAELKGGLDAVAICTPPTARYDIARDCLTGGLHVLLEKPPTATLGDIDELAKLAHGTGLSLFTAWHARYNPAVAAAATLLSDKRISNLQIEWREDVHQWHPGQSWIWRSGGFGVFDAGINAFSIATLLSPAPLLVSQAEFIVPRNMETPIAASLEFFVNRAAGKAALDWRKTSAPAATLEIGTEDGTDLSLREGGSSLYVNQQLLIGGGNTEYRQIYEQFARLIQRGLSEVDREPLRVVADAFLIAQRRWDDPFIV